MDRFNYRSFQLFIFFILFFSVHGNVDQYLPWKRGSIFFCSWKRGTNRRSRRGVRRFWGMDWLSERWFCRRWFEELKPLFFSICLCSLHSFFYYEFLLSKKPQILWFLCDLLFCFDFFRGFWINGFAQVYLELVWWCGCGCFLNSFSC